MTRRYFLITGWIEAVIFVRSGNFVTYLVRVLKIKFGGSIAVEFRIIFGILGLLFFDS